MRIFKALILSILLTMIVKVQASDLNMNSSRSPRIQQQPNEFSNRMKQHSTDEFRTDFGQEQIFNYGPGVNNGTGTGTGGNNYKKDVNKENARARNYNSNHYQDNLKVEEKVRYLKILLYFMNTKLDDKLIKLQNIISLIVEQSLNNLGEDPSVEDEEFVQLSKQSLGDDFEMMTQLLIEISDQFNFNEDDNQLLLQLTAQLNGQFKDSVLNKNIGI